MIKLIGKNLGLHIIIEQSKYLWKVKGELLTTDIGNGYIVVRCLNDVDYETNLFAGPWLMSYHYLLI